MSSLALIAATTVAMLLALGWLFSRLVATRKVFDVDLAWWESFRPDRYAPVLRLLSPKDFAYIAALQGCDRGMRAELRRNRVILMRAYLREMAADFDRLQAIGQLMVTPGKAGQELREELFRQKVRFTTGMWRIRLQMAGFRLGLSQVDASALVGALDGLTVRVRAQSYAAA
ncbi:MAG TPA: hypothetical protein PKJ41_18230 [Bryobacteraceae bacterium]|nr:hypothetical protein [Bryobacteraceae bacterium]HPT28058.1 hypothetical protein [Bryobacteraceae bacterium]